MNRILRPIGLIAIFFTLYPYLAFSAQPEETSEHDKLLSPPSLEVPQPPQDATDPARKGNQRFEQLTIPEHDKLLSPPTFHVPFEVPQPPQNATDSAKKGKQSFEQLTINDKNARELGFDSKTDAADSNTQLGVPLALVLVNFEMLKNYDPSMPPQALLTFAKRFIYPIVVSGKTKSSVTVLELTSPGKSTQEWKPITWGEPGLIRLLDYMRELAGSPSTSFALWIPQLSRYFLGDIRDGKFTIVPLYDELTLGFSASEPKPATEVFRILSAEAMALPVLRRRQQS